MGTDKAKTKEQLILELDELRTYLDERECKLVERGQSLAELRKSEEQCRLMIRNIPAVTWTTDNEGNTVFISSNVEKIYGYTREEIYKAGPGLWFGRIHPDDINRVKDEYEKMFSEQKEFDLTYRIQRKDGTWIWIHDKGLAKYETDGKPYAYGVFIDVTELKQMEEELRISETKFSKTFQLSPNMAHIVRLKDLMRVDINESYTRITGYTREEIIGTTLREFSLIGDPEQMAKGLELLERDGVIYNYELPLRTKSGEVRTILYSGVLLEIDGGKHMMVTGNDITEIKQLQEQLFQSQKIEAVGKLAGGIAHDFNNHLTVILGLCNIILDGLAADDPLRKQIEEILNASERSSSLTRQLLAFSRRQVLKPLVLSLNKIIMGMETMLRRLIGEDVEIIMDLGPDLKNVRIDPSQVEQIILNLAGNARDAMPKGGTISIETANVYLDEAGAEQHPDSHPGPHAMLSISDTGVGMDKATAGRVFEPFFTTKETGKGTGLGLAMVYGIIVQSGGYIRVESEPSRGTTFKIYLPAYDEKAEPIKDVPSTAISSRGSETVLLIEDDDAVREVVGEILKRGGYKVLEAESGDAAMEACKNYKGNIDLVLSDVILPGLKGKELIDRLKQYYPGMKVLYTSGYTDDAVILHGVLKDEMPFIQKPFTSDSLTRKVREVLDT